MKKLLILISLLACSATIFGQNIFTYTVRARGGIIIGLNGIKIDSVTTSNDTLSFWKAGSELHQKGSGTSTMTYPGVGIPLSTGSAWGTSITNNSVNWDTAYAARMRWSGTPIGLTAATGRTSLGGTTVGQAFFTLTNPSAITFPRINADNTVSALSATDLQTAIGTSDIINDTIEAILAAASVGLVINDYEGGSTGNDYYLTPDQVRSLIVSSGGGLNGQILKFIVGTTSGAPTTADSTLTHANFGGKHLDVYRNGALAYYNGAIAANLNEGFRLNTNTITVNPLWQDEEQVEIRILDPIAWSELSLEGEESTLLDSLILYYKLDEASGTLADDATDHQDGAVRGSATRILGKIGNALHTNAWDKLLRSPYNAASDIDTTYSISMWFYLDSLPSVIGGSYLFYAFLPTSPWYSHAIALENTDRIRFNARDDDGNNCNVYSSETLSDSTWYHIVVTCRGDGNTSQIYLNGADVSASADTFTGKIYNTTNYLYFGNTDSELYNTASVIDEIGVWNRVLTVGEVTSLYNAGLGKTHPFIE